MAASTPIPATARERGRLSGGNVAEAPVELRGALDALLRGEPDHDVRVQPEPLPGDAGTYNLRRLVRPHLGAVAIALGLVSAETLLLLAGPLLTQQGIDRGIVPGNTRFLVMVAAGYVATVLVGALATGLRVAWTGRLAQDLNYEQRMRVFTHLQRLSLDFFSEEKAGRIMTRMTSDIEATNQLIQNGIIQMFQQVFTLVVVTIVLFRLNVRLALVTELVIVPALALLTFWFRAASERGYRRVRDAIATLLSDLQESLAGIAVVISHNRRRQNLVHHRNLAGDYRDANVSASRIGALFGSGSMAIGIAGQAAVLLVGGEMVLHGQLTIGALTAFVLFLTAFFAPIQQMAQLYNTYQQGQAAITKLADLLAIQPTVQESPGAVDLPLIDGEILFEDMTFGYDLNRPVLSDINLSIRAGETVALVGATGAGKSTIAKLITRFYDPTAGRILIDGHDLRTVKMDSLRRQLGVVPQEPFMFTGTIRDNLGFARPDASDEELLEAVRVVGLDDLLARQSDGLDTAVEERGASLSSGELQLIALCRAFLAHPRVLVLDEATSNLDLASEARVERALDALLDGRTAIIIAHRLSTAMRADRIAVIDDGRLVELGPHQALVDRGGVYAGMYASWISHLES